MTGIDRGPAGGQQCEQCRLWPFQMESDLMITVRGHLIDIAVPGFARIYAKLLGRLAAQRVQGAFASPSRERLAVVPSHAVAQREGQFGSFLVRGPAGGQIRDDRPHAVLWYVLPVHYEVIENPIIGRSAAAVDSSRSDMLAGLSKWEILRIPPVFWAKAASAAVSASDSTPAAASTRRSRFISNLLFEDTGLSPPLHPCWPVYWALAQGTALGGYHSSSEATMILSRQKPEPNRIVLRGGE